MLTNWNGKTRTDVDVMDQADEKDGGERITYSSSLEGLYGEEHESMVYRSIFFYNHTV